MDEPVRIRNVGPWEIDQATGVLRNGEREAHLTPRATEVLVYLAERTDAPVSPEELLAQLWPNPYSTDGAVHKVVSEIRTTLGDDPSHPQFIRTVPKRGYQLVADVAFDGAIDAPVRRSRRILVLVGIVVAIVIGAWTVQRFWPAPPQPNLAVIPLEVIGDGPGLETLAGVAREELLTELAETALFRVATRGTPPEDVRYRVEGSVRPDAGGAVVALELIDTHSSYQLWADTYAVSAPDLTAGRFFMGPSAARMVEGMVFTNARAAHARTDNRQALEHWLAAEQDNIEASLGAVPDYASRLRHLNRAVALDPDFVEAHLSLAIAYNQRLGFADDRLRHAEARQLAHAYIERALAVAPDDAPSLMMLASINASLDLDYVSAENNLIAARDAGVPWGYIEIRFGTLRLQQGRHADALSHFSGAIESPVGIDIAHAWWGKGVALYCLGQPAEARAALEESLRVAGGAGWGAIAPLAWLQEVHLALGDRDAAEHIYTRLIADYPPEFAFGAAAQLGYEEVVRPYLAEVEARAARGEFVAPNRPWYIYLNLGELGAAFRWLDPAIDERDEGTIILLRSNILPAAFVSDPRFVAAMRKLESLELNEPPV